PGIHDISVSNGQQTAKKEDALEYAPFMIGDVELSLPLLNPAGICGGPNGTLFVTDGNKILKILPDGTTTIFCGSQEPGLQNGIAGDSRFHYPGGIVIDSEEQLYVADQYNHVIRKIGKDGSSST